METILTFFLFKVNFIISGTLWFGSSHQVAKVLELQLQHQHSEYSGMISFRIDCFDLLVVQEILKNPAPQLKSINSSALSLLYAPTLTSIHDYWKNHSFD